MLSRLDAVLFDLDDTLFDHRYAADAAAVEWARGLREWTGSDAEAVAQWLWLENEHFPKYARGEVSLAEQRRLRARGFVPAFDALDDAAADALFVSYLVIYEQFWRPIPGASELLEAAFASGVQVGVLTNGHHAQQQQKLERTGLWRAELSLFASAELGVAKPSPRAFELACAGLGTAPERTVMIGDNYEFDVVAAREAGLLGLYFDRWNSGREAAAPQSLAEVSRVVFG